MDFDLEAARRLTDLEHGIGVMSTFFIMTTSDPYNPSFVKNRSMIREIA